MQVDGLGTVFQLWFSEHPIHDWREARAYADEARFTRWWQEMLLRGVIFHPSQFENLFVSLVHSNDDIDQTLAAAAEVFPILAPGRERREARRSAKTPRRQRRVAGRRRSDGRRPGACATRTSWR